MSDYRLWSCRSPLKTVGRDGRADAMIVPGHLVALRGLCKAGPFIDNAVAIVDRRGILEHAMRADPVNAIFRFQVSDVRFALDVNAVPKAKSLAFGVAH